MYFRLVANQLHVEMSSESDEDEEYWDDKSSGNPGCEVRLEGVELDPTQDADLNWKTEIINVYKKNPDCYGSILRNRRIPRTVLNAHAISTIVDILRWGDS